MKANEVTRVLRDARWYGRRNATFIVERDQWWIDHGFLVDDARLVDHGARGSLCRAAFPMDAIELRYAPPPRTKD
jgi:hypothetical protein